MNKNTEMLEKGSFWQLFLRLSVPSVMVILVMLIYNMADTFFIGQTGDPNKISAISISMPFFAILSAVGTLFGSGGCTTISIALGEKDESKIKNVLSFCAVGSVTIGLLSWLGAFLFAKQLAFLLGADTDTLGFTVTYLRVFSFAGPLIIFNGTFGSILRADGDAATPMISNIVGSVSNILLDGLFVLGFKWDVFGAAFASVLGNILSFSIILFILLKKKPAFMPHVRDLLLKRDVVVPVLTLGLPMLCSTALNSVSGTVSNHLMMTHGSIFLAAQSVSGKLSMISTMLIMGICMGMQPAISYNYGAKSYKRMYQLVWQTGIFSVAVGVGIVCVVALTKNQLIAAFIDNEEVIRYGSTFVIAGLLSGSVYGIYQICQTFLQATGKVSFAVLVSLLEKGIVYLPILFLLNAKYGPYGVAFSHVVTMAATIGIAIALSVFWAKEIKKRGKI